ncbi:hypothetical protein FGIG_06928 [Fasciola gigantica]|uniref:39S ribosomal protein L32 mitochondrial n=1 Tax=Fasciola gigantica TaxID=46835 RepID=A0A504YAE2_FASGI|nr:hypothetical protein FGIG_06928 [Fasciola gigantica]
MDLLRRFFTECTIIFNILRSPHWPKGLTPAVYSGIDFGHSPLWSLDSDALSKGLFLATPKKRRSLELRRIRRFLPFVMDKYKPRDDLVSCLNCGFLHPSGCLCVNCYNKVRDEMSVLRSQIGDRLPSDTKFHYVVHYTHPRSVASDGTVYFGTQ